jgi:hypothetical protein
MVQNWTNNDGAERWLLGAADSTPECAGAVERVVAGQPAVDLLSIENFAGPAAIVAAEFGDRPFEGLRTDDFHQFLAALRFVK